MLTHFACKSPVDLPRTLPTQNTTFAPTPDNPRKSLMKRASVSPLAASTTTVPFSLDAPRADTTPAPFSTPPQCPKVHPCSNSLPDVVGFNRKRKHQNGENNLSRNYQNSKNNLSGGHQNSRNHFSVRHVRTAMRILAGTIKTAKTTLTVTVEAVRTILAGGVKTAKTNFTRKR